MSQSSSSASASGGISFLGMLAVLFIGLKLTNYIDWPWYWVLSPLWLPPTVVLIAILATGLGGLAMIAIAEVWERLTVKGGRS